jgi:Cellulase (glycosyl hydrolase family 5)
MAPRMSLSAVIRAIAVIVALHAVAAVALAASPSRSRTAHHQVARERHRADTHRHRRVVGHRGGKPRPALTRRRTSPCSPAPFPSVLHTRGRTLIDANGCTLPVMKGFSIQIGPWSEGTMKSIAAKGVKFERLVLFWDELQSTDCSALSATGQTYIAEIDQQLAWARAAGIYTELDLHLNVGRIPACASGGATEFDDYTSHGQWITQFLARRFGSTSSPEYTADVVGFGLNEPAPVSEPPPANSNTIMEHDQSTMLSWIRGPGGTGGYAPQWIGFVAYAYANATPIFNALPGQTNQCSTCANGNPNAYDSVGGNIVLDFHDYLVGCTSGWAAANPGSPADDCDGREYDGEVYNDSNGGWEVNAGESIYRTYPISGESEATARAQLANYIYPYTKFTKEANIPLMIGEFGWDAAVNTTGGRSYLTDLMASWSSASPAIELEWDYGVTQSHDGWASDPGSSALSADNSGWSSFAGAFLAARPVRRANRYRTR